MASLTNLIYKYPILLNNLNFHLMLVIPKLSNILTIITKSISVISIIKSS